MPLAAAVFWLTRLHAFDEITGLEVALAIILAAAGFLVAAWGAFVSSGSDDATNWPAWIASFASVGSGVVLSVSFATILGVVLAADMGLNREYAHQEWREARFRIDQAGNVVPITKYAFENEWMMPSVSLNLGNPGRYITRDLIGLTGTGFYDADSYAVQINGTDLVYDRGRRTLENYRLKKFEGSLGPDGFHKWDEPVVPFPEPLRSVRIQELRLLIADSTSAYTADLPLRTMEKVFETGADDPILDAAWAFDNKTIVVATRSAIHILESGKERLRIPFDPEAVKPVFVNVGSSSRGGYILAYRCGTEDHLEISDWVEVVSDQGQVVRRTEMKPTYDTVTIQNQPYVELMRVGMPPALAYGFNFLEEDVFEDGHDGVLKDVGLGIAWAIAMFFLGEQFLKSKSSRLAWSVVAFFLGIPGLLLMMSMNERKPTIACASCGKQRRISDQRCAQCGADAARPAMQGIEVFEEAGV